ncbi:putative subtilase-type serine protease precursor [Thalassoglobus neptunius]|uniref:Putative subtilase-type serine protease n=1 Tax=Thalassoglobus neptunius TaxID=1938619 RepID=A0A5C5VYQ8_9PLAN|nr:PPC domain-containing protein [Thalassoglobus neptunius]TWT43544.1 putative subtilase-type serine protease precursor [Thalassoglobus neptunius]
MHASAHSLLVCVFVLSATALSAPPKVEKALPGVGKQGSRFELRLQGSELEKVSEVHFYREGLVCHDVQPDSENEEQFVATVEAAADCPLGNHPYRLRNEDGFSDLRVLRVLSSDSIEEVEPNNDAGAAQPIPIGVSILGVLESGDVDRYRVTLKKGDRLAAEVEGIRLAMNLTDSRLHVTGPDGSLVTSADDTNLARQDPYFSMLAPLDGEYVITVDTSGSDGDENTRYVLHVGDFPRPDYVYPPGGPVNQSIDVEVKGDATASWKQSLTVSTTGTYSFFPESNGKRPPTPIPFRVSPFGNVLEAEPNQTIDDGSNAPNLPIAFNGTISESGDEDFFSFRCQKGDMIEFAVYAMRIGSPVDTVISIHRNDGSLVTSNDDRHGLDSGLVWNCPQDGVYFLKVIDKQRAGGERFIYRVEADYIEPSLETFLAKRARQTQDGQTISVPQGNRSVGFFGVRRNRWSGNSSVEFPSLPGGVGVDAEEIDEDEYLMPVIFTASEDASIGGSLLPVVARSAHNGPTILGGYRQPVDLVSGTADRLFQGVEVDRLALAVTQSVPFKINFLEPPTGLPRDGSIELLVHVDRDEGFHDPIEVSIPFLPTWVDGPEKITIPSNESIGRFELRSHRQVKTGTWPIVAEGKAGDPTEETDQTAASTGRSSYNRQGPASGSHSVSTQILPFQVIESPISAELGQLFATPGTAVNLTIPLTVSGEMPTSCIATLSGLPSRVSAEPVELASDADKVTFEVQFADNAPLGLFEGLHCEISSPWNDHQVTYRIGRGGSVKIVNRDDFQMDETGRPLTPLEILRTIQTTSEEPLEANTEEHPDSTSTK